MDDSENLMHKILTFCKEWDEVDENYRAINRKQFSEDIRIQANNLYNKVKHDQTEHRKILSMYTICITYAPKDSEQLPKGLSNRAALLMHLQLYEEALIDIDKALQLSKSDEFTAKLVSRKEKCLKLKENNSSRKFPNNLPKIQPSKIIPNASEAATVTYSEKFGRHLIATRDIKPGEVIIAEESYICYPLKGRNFVRCSHCVRSAWNGIPCDNCVWAIYCSEECKKEAWQEYHDVECPIISSLISHLNEKVFKSMLVLRLFIKAIKREGFTCVMNEIKRSNEEKDHIKKLLYDGVLDSNKFRSYYNLESHAQDEKKYLDFDNALFIVTLLINRTTIIPIRNNLKEMDSAENELIFTLTEAFMRLGNIIGHNSFSYKPLICDCIDKENKDLCCQDNGILIAVTCSLINHSCCPNVCKIFLPKRKIAILATAPIKKDQLICDSYGPVFSLKKEERQHYLQDNYHFNCSCQACEENWPHDVEQTIAKQSITTSSKFDKIMEEFEKYYPNDQSSSQNILTLIINQSTYEKSTLEKVLIFCNLLYKYFDYRTAYYHCHQFMKPIKRSFLTLYAGDVFVLPKGC